MRNCILYTNRFGSNFIIFSIGTFEWNQLFHRFCSHYIVALLILGIYRLLNTDTDTNLDVLCEITAKKKNLESSYN